VARYHKVAVTLPYFIPLPYLSPFGTMGAFIMLKSPPTNRRVLLDIGIAGPLAGFLVAIPVLIYGLMTSPVQPLPTTFLPGQGISLEGNSIIYILAKLAIFHQFLPAPASFGNLPPWLYMLRYYLLGFPVPLGGKDVLLNQVAWAGWAGLLVTGLNLIPAGQLDGGHALYVLVGQRARRLVPFIIVILVGLGFFWPGWFLWAGLIYFLGRTHAEPLDQITELDPRRKALAVLALVLFLLVITPIPLLIVGA
jgi:membrane-associated protease RseP (regulator of RpoE activity)